MKRPLSLFALALAVTASLATESTAPDEPPPEAGVFGEVESVFTITEVGGAPSAIAATDYYEVAYLVSSDGNTVYTYENGAFKQDSSMSWGIVEIVENLNQTGGAWALRSGGSLESFLWDGYSSGTMPQADNYPTGTYCDLTMDDQGSPYFSPHGHYISTVDGNTATLWRDYDEDPGPGSETDTWISVEVTSDSCPQIAWDDGSVYALLDVFSAVEVFDEDLNHVTTAVPAPWCTATDLVAVGGYAILGGTTDAGTPCLQAFDTSTETTTGFMEIPFDSVTAMDVLVDGDGQAWVYIGGLHNSTPYLRRIPVN